MPSLGMLSVGVLSVGVTSAPDGRTVIHHARSAVVTSTRRAAQSLRSAANSSGKNGWAPSGYEKAHRWE